MSTKDLVAEVRKELQNIKLDDPMAILEKPGSSSGSGSQAGPSTGPELMDTEAGSSSTGHNTTVLVMLGMAGAGKTCWTQRFASHLLSQNKAPYIVNLDPATEDLPFPVNIDIRDTIDYHKVMMQYNLGPNGAIVTALNLFATKFDQVLDIIKVRSRSHEYILVDTPGQIECFLWSASGQIMLQSLAALFPTIIVYVTDMVRCMNPVTFVSNMSYGITIFFKNKLPIIITLNKADVNPSNVKIVKEWITDFEKFQEALYKCKSYSATYASSLALALEEFYCNVEHVAVSAYDGFGLQEFSNSVQKSVKEYETVYVPMYQKMKESYRKSVEKQKAQELSKLHSDLKSASLPNRGGRDESGGLFSATATSGSALGFDLMWGDKEDDDTSSSEEEMDKGDAEEEDEASLGDFVKLEAVKREAKRRTDPNDPGPSQTPS